MGTALWDIRGMKFPWNFGRKSSGEVPHFGTGRIEMTYLHMRLAYKLNPLFSRGPVYSGPYILREGGMMKRGEIYTARLEKKAGSVQYGLRPVLVLQNNKGNRFSTTTIVAAITSRNRSLYQQTHVLLSDEYGLKKKSMVLLEQIMTVEKGQLEKYVGRVSDADMKRIDRAVLVSVAPKTLKKDYMNTLITA